MDITLQQQSEFKKQMEQLAVFCFRGYQIPEYMREGIAKHVAFGVPNGSFLTAMLSCNMEVAMNHADDTNMWLLPVYYAYFFNHIPMSAWGTAERVHLWKARCLKERENANKDANKNSSKDSSEHSYNKVASIQL